MSIEPRVGVRCRRMVRANAPAAAIRGATCSNRTGEAGACRKLQLVLGSDSISDAASSVILSWRCRFIS